MDSIQGHARWGFVSLLTWGLLLVEQGHDAEMGGGLCRKQAEDWGTTLPEPSLTAWLASRSRMPLCWDVCLNHTPDGTHFTGWELCLQDVSAAPHPVSRNMDGPLSRCKVGR